MAKPAHAHGGNCWCGRCSRGPNYDVCMKHELPRGECDACPRCPRCDSEPEKKGSPDEG